MKEEFFTIEDAGDMRIDKFLSGELSTLSRSHIQKLIKDGNVFVNSNPIKANYKISQGDKICVQIPELKEPDILPEDIALDILYEDEDILIVNKPKGMVVHPVRGIIREHWSTRFCITVKTAFQGSTVCKDPG